jgi:hypothetical protein
MCEWPLPWISKKVCLTRALGRQIAAWLSPDSAHPSLLTSNSLLPILLQSGAAGFAWTRIEGTPQAESFMALQDYYRKEALYAKLHEREISRCAALLQERGVPCLFGKGWSVARRYPGWGMRACGDIDVYVAVHQLQQAKAAIGDDSSWAVSIDLHGSCQEFSGETFEALSERAEQVILREVVCCFIPPEEHLRLLTFHSLRHGLARPVWLLDIGFYLRAVGDSLDWARVTALSPTRLSWLKGVIWLAHAALGFPLPEALQPFRPLPGWVLDEVYHAWGRPYWARLPVLSLWREPWQMLQEIPRHWPNLIEAVYEQGRPFHEKTFTSQAAVFLQRSRKILPRFSPVKKES